MEIGFLILTKIHKIIVTRVLVTKEEEKYNIFLTKNNLTVILLWVFKRLPITKYFGFQFSKLIL